MRLPLFVAGVVLSTASYAQQNVPQIPGTALTFRYQCPEDRPCAVICWSNVGKIEYQDVTSAQLVEYFSRPQQSTPGYLLVVTAKGNDIPQNTHIQGSAACSFTQMQLLGTEGPRAPERSERRAPTARAPRPPADTGPAASPPAAPAPPPAATPPPAR